MRRLLAGWLVFGSCLCSDGSSVLAQTENTSGDFAAKPLLERALREEAAGNLQEREQLLASAASAYPDEPAIRWQQGLVRQGNRWLSIESVIREAAASKDLERYRQLRDVSEPTLESQLMLARTCQRLRLQEQERAHWFAILQLDPDHAEARKRLGFIRVGSQWQLPEEKKAVERQAAAIATALRRYHAEYSKLANEVRNGAVPRDTAVTKLLEHDDPNVIPAWERYLSTANSAAAQVVVAALSKSTSPESAPSLARHALFHDSPTVRQEATAALSAKERSLYVPSLLAELRGTWISDRVVRRAAPNRLVVRHTLYVDEQQRQQLRVLDETFFLAGDIDLAGSIAMSMANATRATTDAERRRANEAIESRNTNVMNLLASATRVTTNQSPQDWWKWWDEQCEVYVSGDKPLTSSYAARSQTVEAVRPSVESSSTDVTRPVRRCDCLAAGTRIVTNRGLTPIERIRIGDLVLSQHPVTGELAMKPVTQTTVRPPESLLQIQLGENQLRASGGHPFWVSGRGWVRARELQPEMTLHGAAGGQKISATGQQETPSYSYNLVVADFHTYFVSLGKQTLLSHDNTPPVPTRVTVPGLSQP